VSYLAGFAAPVALGALAFSEYLSHFFPALRVSQQADALQSGGCIWVPAGAGVGHLALFTVTNILGLSLAARLQSAITISTLGVLAAFLVLAFTVGHGQWSNFAATATRTSTHGFSAPSLPPRWFL